VGWERKRGRPLREKEERILSLRPRERKRSENEWKMALVALYSSCDVIASDLTLILKPIPD
jgi:hypothetical protein